MELPEVGETALIRNYLKTKKKTKQPQMNADKRGLKHKTSSLLSVICVHPR
jgi:hypothetical protein